jgi:hypothetical protein
MTLLGRYYSPRDLKFINSVNGELMNNIIQSFVKIYRISADATKTNVYGEATGETGKVYEPGVLISARIEHPDTQTNQEGYGSDKVKKGLRFNFQELACKEAGIFPFNGDIIEWDAVYFEIDNIIQEQHLGGQYEKSHSIIAEVHMSKTSALNVVDRARTSE